MTESELRKIDALVAEHIFPGKEFKPNGISLNPKENWIPQYSVSIADAWEVVEKLKYFEIQSPGAPCNGDEYANYTELWSVELGLEPNGEERSVFALADTAPLAICLAALKAKGIEI